MTLTESWIRLEDVGCTYPGPNPVRALAGVNETIEQGEFVAILGPSGSGKSTLLFVLAGLTPRTSGRLTMCGVESPSRAEFTHLRRTSIGIVFQNYHLLSHITAVDNVTLGELYSGRSIGQRRSRAVELLGSVGLADRLHHLPGELSGGEQQRVAIARALAHQPSVVIADEPTGNLDSHSGRRILDELTEQHRSGTTVLVATHSREVAERADRRIHILDGVVIADG